MKLLKQINAALPQPVVEDAGAVGAGSVAGVHLPLFSALVKRAKPKADKIEAQPLPTAKKKSLKLGEAFNKMNEELDASAGGEENTQATRQAAIDTADTIARLKSMETRNTADKRDVVVFGLEDENGGVVRVSIKPDQAKEFEQALQNFVNDQEAGENDHEIAEILFSMRDHFDIIDVEWPEVQEDEEVVPDMEGGDPAAEGMPGEDPNADPSAEMPPTDDTAAVTSLLGQVIGMMQADAAARYADAKAREAEAKTREAKAIVTQSMDRVKQEEQFLDMETAQKAEKEQAKETKRLAALAKWKRGVEQETGVTDYSDDEMEQAIPDAMGGQPQQQGREEEERVVTRTQGMPQARPPVRPAGKPRVAPRDIASFILKRVQ